MCVCVCLLQIQLTPMSSGLPHLATLPFNRLSRSILLRFSRALTGGFDIHKSIPFLPTGSNVAVQWEDEGHWMHGPIVKHGPDDHRGRSYKVWVTKIGCIITGMKKQMRANISRRLPEEGDVQSQQTTRRWQVEQTHRLLCFTEPTWTLLQ